ncbi:cysteine desulfurase [Bavariicoccus seileri]|uniref:cysteine desulfurase n=1 Tax=Bavariicoccus seileri TaxID=549685 RepID=UPI003F92EFE9
MAFNKTASLPGFDTAYQVSPNCKKYTLRDNGFVETRNKNFEFIRDLDTPNGESRRVKLKITINQTLDGLRISTVSPNGLQQVNITRLVNNEMAIEKASYLMENFVATSILEIVPQ